MLDLLFVIIGGFFEPAWVFAMEKAGHAPEKTRKYAWYVLCLVLMYCSLMFLSLGMRSLNIGIAYAIWTAIGAVVTIFLSRIFLDESLNRCKILAVVMILIGISGLEISGGL